MIERGRKNKYIINIPSIEDRHQTLKAFQEGKRTIKIISADDTDVFVLSSHVCKSTNMNAEVLLEDFNNNKSIISICKTVKENISIVSSILSAHALSRCDTVPRMFGIGKEKLIKVLRKFPLTYLGNITAEEQEYIKEGKLFVARFYEVTNINSTENR